MKNDKITKVFISGPMRGYENNNTEMFNKCEEAIVNMGYDVFNPAWLKYGESWDINDIRCIDMLALKFCDTICYLPGYEKAEGCVIEKSFADAFSKTEMFFDGVSITKINVRK